MTEQVRSGETDQAGSTSAAEEQYRRVSQLPEKITIPGTNQEVLIDRKFLKLLRQLNIWELRELEENLVREQKARDPLVVWRQERILLDGHHRALLCLKHGFPFTIDEQDFPDRAAAEEWMRKNQLGKRNLTPEQEAVQRGKLYNKLKKNHGGDRKTAAAKDATAGSTVDALAAEARVSRATLKRDGEFARNVTTIVAVCGEQAEGLMVGPERKLDRKEVKLLAALHPEEQKKVIAEVERTGRWNRKPEPKPVQNTPDDAASPGQPGTPSSDGVVYRITGSELKKGQAIALEKGTTPKNIAAALYHFYGRTSCRKIIKLLDGFLGGSKPPVKRMKAQPVAHAGILDSFDSFMNPG